MKKAISAMLAGGLLAAGLGLPAAAIEDNPYAQKTKAMVAEEKAARYYQPVQKQKPAPAPAPEAKPEVEEAPEQAEPGIVDVVLAVSGTEGFDKNKKDYDLLREALVATDLAGAVAASDDITVLAPNDRAFIRLARDLGYEGRDEAGVFAFLAAATGFESAQDPGLLDDVLLYHVVPGAQKVKQLQGENATLLDGATITVKHRKVIDGDPDDRDARIRKPKNIVTSNGIIHTVNRVLRPIDL